MLKDEDIILLIADKTAKEQYMSLAFEWQTKTKESGSLPEIVDLSLLDADQSDEDNGESMIATVLAIATIVNTVKKAHIVFVAGENEDNAKINRCKNNIIDALFNVHESNRHQGGLFSRNVTNAKKGLKEKNNINEATDLTVIDVNNHDAVLDHLTKLAKIKCHTIATTVEEKVKEIEKEKEKEKQLQQQRHELVEDAIIPNILIPLKKQMELNVEHIESELVEFCTKVTKINKNDDRISQMTRWIMVANQLKQISELNSIAKVIQKCNQNMYFICDIWDKCCQIVNKWLKNIKEKIIEFANKCNNNGTAASDDHDDINNNFAFLHNNFCLLCFLIDSEVGNDQVIETQGIIAEYVIKYIQQCQIRIKELISRCSRDCSQYIVNYYKRIVSIANVFRMPIVEYNYNINEKNSENIFEFIKKQEIASGEELINMCKILMVLLPETIASERILGNHTNASTTKFISQIEIVNKIQNCSDIIKYSLSNEWYQLKCSCIESLNDICKYLDTEITNIESDWEKAEKAPYLCIANGILVLKTPELFLKYFNDFADNENICNEFKQKFSNIEQRLIAYVNDLMKRAHELGYRLTHCYNCVDFVELVQFLLNLVSKLEKSGLTKVLPKMGDCCQNINEYLINTLRQQLKLIQTLEISFDEKESSSNIVVFGINAKTNAMKIIQSFDFVLQCKTLEWADRSTFATSDCVMELKEFEKEIDSSIEYLSAIFSKFGSLCIETLKGGFAEILENLENVDYNRIKCREQVFCLINILVGLSQPWHTELSKEIITVIFQEIAKYYGKLEAKCVDMMHQDNSNLLLVSRHVQTLAMIDWFVTFLNKDCGSQGIGKKGVEMHSFWQLYKRLANRSNKKRDDIANIMSYDIFGVKFNEIQLQLEENKIDHENITINKNVIDVHKSFYCDLIMDFCDITQIQLDLLLNRQMIWKNKFKNGIPQNYACDMSKTKELLMQIRSQHLLDICDKHLGQNTLSYFQSSKQNIVEFVENWTQERLEQKLGCFIDEYPMSSWIYQRLIWIGFYKNSKNENCLIDLLPKDIVSYILIFAQWNFLEQLESFCKFNWKCYGYYDKNTMYNPFLLSYNNIEDEIEYFENICMLYQLKNDNINIIKTIKQTLIKICKDIETVYDKYLTFETYIDYPVRYLHDSCVRNIIKGKSRTVWKKCCIEAFYRISDHVNRECQKEMQNLDYKKKDISTPLLLRCVASLSENYFTFPLITMGLENLKQRNLTVVGAMKDQISLVIDTFGEHATGTGFFSMSQFINDTINQSMCDLLYVEKSILLKATKLESSIAVYLNSFELKDIDCIFEQLDVLSRLSKECKSIKIDDIDAKLNVILDRIRNYVLKRGLTSVDIILTMLGLFKIENNFQGIGDTGLTILKKEIVFVNCLNNGIFLNDTKEKDRPDSEIFSLELNQRILQIAVMIECPFETTDVENDDNSNSQEKMQQDLLIHVLKNKRKSLMANDQMYSNMIDSFCSSIKNVQNKINSL